MHIAYVIIILLYYWNIYIISGLLMDTCSILLTKNLFRLRWFQISKWVCLFEKGFSSPSQRPILAQEKDFFSK